MHVYVIIFKRFIKSRMYVSSMNVVFLVLVQLKALDSSSTSMNKKSCPASCPITKEKWKERAIEYSCLNNTSYHCINITQEGVCELCFDKFTVFNIGCPMIEWDEKTKKYYPNRHAECPVNITGCPGRNLTYYSDELYRFPLCVQSNISAHVELRSSPITPSQTSRTTEYNISTTSSTNTDSGHDNVTTIIIVGVVLGFIIICTLLVAFWKRKAIYDCVTREIRHRRKRSLSRSGTKNGRETDEPEDDPLITKKKGESEENEHQDVNTISHAGDPITSSTANTQSNQKVQNSRNATIQKEDENNIVELKSDEQSLSGTYRVCRNQQVSEPDLITTTHLPTKTNDISSKETMIFKDMDNQHSTTSFEHSQFGSFETDIWATFTEKKCVLRCKVSHVDVNCTWYKKQTNGDMSKINDGDEFKVCQEKTFRILCLPRMPGSDGTYVCSLDNGDEIEIDIDVEDSGTTKATVGEDIKLVRKLDETGSRCSWYKNQTLLHNDELYIITDTNEVSTLTIKRVRRGDLIPFGSKIGQEMQYYTLDSEDTENAETDQTDLRLLDCDNAKENNETGCLANPMDETDSESTQEEGQSSSNVDFHQPFRKVHEEYPELTKILGKVFRESEWNKITSCSQEMVTVFKSLPQTTFEVDDLSELKHIALQSMNKCKSSVSKTFICLYSILSNFENIPDVGNSAFQRKNVREQRVFIQNLIAFEKGFKADTVDLIASIKGKITFFEDKLLEVERDLQTKKVYTDEKNSLRDALSIIIMHFEDICDSLQKIKDSLFSLASYLQTYLPVPQTSREISTVLHILRTEPQHRSDSSSFESIGDSLNKELKKVYLDCNAATRGNVASMDDTEVNNSLSACAERVDLRLNNL